MALAGTGFPLILLVSCCPGHKGHSARAMFGRDSVRTESVRPRLLYSRIVFRWDSVQAEFCSAVVTQLGQSNSARPELCSAVVTQLEQSVGRDFVRTESVRPRSLCSGIDQAEDKTNPKPWYTADEKSSKMSTEDLQELIREYPLPKGWYARLPGLQEPANYGTKFETGIYEEQVKSGYRLPLHPFALRFFEHYHMAPGKLVPNGWRKLVGLIYLVQTSGYKPDATDFMGVFFEIYFVKGVANYPGWYYIHSRQWLLKGGPKSNKGWQSRYFFVGRLDKGKLPFDRDWNPYCKDFENPGKPIPNNLTKHILSHIKLRGGLSINEPLSEEQLEWAKIIPPKPFPAGLSLPPPPAIPSVSSVETVPLEMASRSGNHHKEVFLAFFRKLRGSEKRSSQLYAGDSEILSRFEMARQVGEEEAHQKREAIKEAQEAIHLVEELSKQEADHLAQILTLEKRLERAKRGQQKR
ncbi:hypothetical protein RJ639_030869 [Escallonia herrerae]|uniref:Transposase (putative) gypsy type domain-containing protein n=1 Tax=Escallonia herrerae TaxID=1293975 RepID=A0AA88X9W8_9ASTE|nr:hypothetical protein RJ639_030869 [Escallonia herrerae]